MRIEYSELGLQFLAEPTAFFVKEGNFWGLLSFAEKSRYFGFSFFDGEQAYRIISEINFSFSPEVVLINQPNNLLFLTEQRKVRFSFSRKGFLIKQAGNYPIKVSFDARPLFITQPKRKIVLQERGENKVKVDWFYQDRLIAEGLFLSKGPIKIYGVWQKELMSFDQKRNSPPFAFDNFFGFETEADYLEFKLTKPYLPPSIQPLRETGEPLIDFVLQRINHLFFNQYLPAGFPWFYEKWYRDELISLWLLRDFLDPEWLFNYLQSYLMLKEEELFLSKKDGILSADTLLWLINLIPEEFFSMKRAHLEHIFYRWLKIFAPQGKIDLPAKATWMDTLERKDPIEVSALLIKAGQRLGLTNLVKKERKRLQNRLFALLKGKLDEEEEREIFRPNIFLVRQLLPDLFWQPVWRRIILAILEKVQLPWGGISSLAFTEKNFLPIHTGEDPRSYHQGDSWHFLNALASKSLFELKEDRLANRIFALLTKELFCSGTPGYLAELSSAQSLKSEGALVQTWSMCAFLSLLSSLPS